MSKTRCSTCGNPIPSWAHGVCYACQRIIFRKSKFRRQTERRVPRVRPERRKYFVLGTVQSTIPLRPINKDQSRTSQGSDKLQSPLSDWHRVARKYLEGLNRLLKDAYGDGVRMSQLLLKSGLSSQQIEGWRKDYWGVFTLVCHIEGKLEKLLKNANPRCDPCVISKYYLDGLSIREIACLNKREENGVKLDHGLLLSFLKSTKGRSAFENIIVESAKTLSAKRAHSGKDIK